MKTYALVYRFTDGKASQEFRNSVESEFEDIRVKKTDLFEYIGFVARQEPAVEDALNKMLSHISNTSTIDDDDYVALYFSPEHDNEKINRQMVYGKDDYIDSDVTENYKPEHFSVITDLLEYDPVKHKEV